MSGRSENNQNIQVYVRVRPMSSQEFSKNAAEIVDTPGFREVVVRERSVANVTKTFTFDKVFGPRSKQVDVYKTVVAPLLHEVLLGYNCTVFAYGQTGTGKTFTMEGERSPKGAGGGGDARVGIEKDPMAGILPRALSQVFDDVRLMNCEFTVRVSFLELYNEELFDLLAPIEESKTKTIRIFEDSNRKGSVIIHGLEEVIVQNKQEVYNVLERGSQQRKTAATLMNASSSRSHTVFTITVHMKESSVEGEEMVKVGKLHLVDLAGSENIGKSGAVDKRAREAGSINQSLLTLGRVISALVERAPHIPYRESKLTRILQDSLGGKTKTSIIATVSPASVNIEETLNTLEYAHRAKNIMNKPEVNQRLTKKEALNIYSEEIERLRRDLNATREKNGVYVDVDNYNGMISQIYNLNQELNDKSNTISDLNDVISSKDQEINEALALIQELQMDLSLKQQLLEESNSRGAALQSKLMGAENRIDDLQHLLNVHVNTETKLSGEATVLLKTANDTVVSIDALHARLERKKQVENKNWQNSKVMRETLGKSVGTICQELDALRQRHVVYTSFLREQLGNRSTERQRLNSNFNQIFVEASSKMIDIETKIITLVENFNLQSQHRINSDDGLMNEHVARNKVRLENMKEALLDMLKALKTSFGMLKSDITKLKADVELQFDKMESEITQGLTSDIRNFSLLEESVQEIQSKLEEFVADIEKYSKCATLEQDKFKEGYKRKLAVLQTTIEEMRNEAEDYTSVSTTAKKELMEKVDSFWENTKKELEGSAKMLKTAKEIPERGVNCLKEYREGHLATHQSQLGRVFERLDGAIVSSRKIEKRIGEVHKNQEAQMGSLLETMEKIGSSYVGGLREFHGDLKGIMEDHSTACDLMRRDISKKLEKFCEKDSTALVKIKKDADSHCEFVTQSVGNVGKEVEQTYERVEAFWEEEYLVDMPTGATPMRRKYEYPTKLSRTSPHERVIERYRNVRSRNAVQSAIDECAEEEGSGGNDQDEDGKKSPMAS